MRPLLRLDEETLKAVSAYLLSVVDEKVLDAVYRGESPSAATVKSAIADGIARVIKEQKKLREQARKA
jgi:hypothetical protein